MKVENNNPWLIIAILRIITYNRESFFIVDSKEKVLFLHD